MKWDITVAFSFVFRGQVKKQFCGHFRTCFWTELMIIFQIVSGNKEEWCFSCQIVPLCPHSIRLCALFLAKQLVLKTTDVQTWNFTIAWCTPFYLAMKLCNLFFREKKKKNQLPNNWSRWTRWSYAEWKESQLFLTQKLFYAFDHLYCPSLKLFQIYYILSEERGQDCIQYPRRGCNMDLCGCIMMLFVLVFTLLLAVLNF